MQPSEGYERERVLIEEGEMIKKYFKFGVLLIVLYLLAGCAPSYYSEGRKHVQRQDYDAAIEAFETALQENPEDTRMIRELGIVHFKKKDLDKAFPLLLKAFIADSTDGRTLFYLGSTYELTQQLPYAIDIYRRYVDVSRWQGIRGSLEARMARLIQRQIEGEIQVSLDQEAAIDASSFQENTIAVLTFKNMGQQTDLDAIQKGLTDMLITDLSKVIQLQVVERIRMQKLVEEMGLGSTGLVEYTEAPRVAKLLRASRLIQGTFMDLTDESLRIDAGIAQTSNRQHLTSESVQGKLAQFFQMEKDLVFALIDGMGISLSQEERDEIEIIPTENLLAFMAYCRGLDFEDRGMYREAADAYDEAAKLDPGYSQAGQKRSRCESLAVGEIDLSEIQRLVDQTTMPLEPVQASELNPVMIHVLHMGTMLNQGFLPGVESRKPIQEQSRSSFGNSANINVSIPLPENR